MNNCIFCRIIAKEIPAQIIAENETVLVIKDINPQAPIHYLIIPKKHVTDIGALTLEDTSLAGSLLLMAQYISNLPGCDQFKLHSNNGPRAGQVVFHIHIHFCAGW